MLCYVIYFTVLLRPLLIGNECFHSLPTTTGVHYVCIYVSTNSGLQDSEAGGRHGEVVSAVDNPRVATAFIIRFRGCIFIYLDIKSSPERHVHPGNSCTLLNSSERHFVFLENPEHGLVAVPGVVRHVAGRRLDRESDY